MRVSHIDPRGTLRMVDVSAKPLLRRTAAAEATVHLPPPVVSLLRRRLLQKGDALACAALAGIQAAKMTADLIPLCHRIPVAHVAVDFKIARDRIRILATATTTAQTGVEMEALTAAAVAALTLYDMCKSAATGISITGIRLCYKRKTPVR